MENKDVYIIYLLKNTYKRKNNSYTVEKLNNPINKRSKLT